MIYYFFINVDLKTRFVKFV